jgi:hypothetical protein
MLLVCSLNSEAVHNLATACIAAAQQPQRLPAWQVGDETLQRDCFCGYIDTAAARAETIQYRAT